MMTNILSTDSYAEFKDLVRQAKGVPILSESSNHFSLTLGVSGLTYHRHVIKGTSEAEELLADNWPFVTCETRIEYGTYTLSGSTSYTNRKEICAMAPQMGRTLTVSSKTTNTLTFPDNTFFRASYSSMTVASVSTEGIRLNVSGANRAFTTDDVGMRLVLEEAGHDTTYCYVVDYISGTAVLVDGFLQGNGTNGAYTTAATVKADLTGRYVKLRPSVSLLRYRVISFSGDILTIATEGLDLTTPGTVESIVRLSSEEFLLERMVISGYTADVVVILELKDSTLYGDTAFHLLGKFFYAYAGGTQVIPMSLTLEGVTADMLKVSIHNVTNSSGVGFVTLIATAKT